MDNCIAGHHKGSRKIVHSGSLPPHTRTKIKRPKNLSGIGGHPPPLMEKSPLSSILRLSCWDGLKKQSWNPSANAMHFY